MQLRFTHLVGALLRYYSAIRLPIAACKPLLFVLARLTSKASTFKHFSELILRLRLNGQIGFRALRGRAVAFIESPELSHHQETSVGRLRCNALFVHTALDLQGLSSATEPNSESLRNILVVASDHVRSLRKSRAEPFALLLVSAALSWSCIPPDQFDRSNDFWSVQSKYTIDPSNLPEFVRVC